VSTLTEIEEAVPRLSQAELDELEHFIRQEKMHRVSAVSHSVLDIGPVSLGPLQGHLGDRDEWHDEMLEGRL
jgi:hypothetical protein